MASGAVDRIDSIYDLPALTAQQKAVEDLVKKTVAQIKAARKESIEFNVGTKSFDDYNKKVKGLEKTLAGMQVASDKAIRTSILMEKQKQAEANALEKLAKQQLAEIKLREANEKAIKKEQRPIGSIPFEIKTGGRSEAEANHDFNNAQVEAIQAANEWANAQRRVNDEINDTSTATDNLKKNVIAELSPLQQNIELRRRLQASMASYLADQKEDAALLKTGAITRAEYNRRLTESQAKVAVYKTKLQELNRVIKEESALESKASDVYKRLSIEYNRAALAAKNYQITLGATNPVTIAAVANAKRLSDQLKFVDNAVGQNNRYVGNYSEAISRAGKKIFGVFRSIANFIPGLGMGALFAIIGTGIASLVNTLGLFNKRLEDSARAKKILTAVTEESSASIAKESTSLQVLRATIESTKVPMETRLQAIKDLREQYPEYFNNLTNEQILTGNVADAYDLAAAAIIRKARASAAANQIELNAVRSLKIEQDALADVEKTNEKLRDKRGNTTVDEFGNVINVTKQTNTLLKDAFKKRRDLRQQERADIKKDNDFLLKIALEGAKETVKIDKLKTETIKKEPKGRDLTEANRKAQFEILKADLELAKEFDLRRAADVSKSLEFRLKALESFGVNSQLLIDATNNYEKGAKGLTSKEIEKIDKDKYISLEKLATDFYDRLINITKNFAAKYETEALKPLSKSIPKELQKILDDFRKMQNIAIEKSAEDAEKAIKKALETLANELGNLFFDLAENSIEREKNAIQDQIDLLELKKQKEIEAANQSITNAADKADAIAVIEARAAAQKQQLELKQRQLDQQKAKFEKGRAVAQIIANTAQGVTAALATIPPNPILAAIVAAIGVAQLTRVLAQPIPRYKEGTENHPGGLAVVGDGGKSEGLRLPDGSIYKSPATATIVDMPKGSKVYKDYSNMRVAASGELQVFDTREELRTGFNQVVGAIKRIPQPIIQAERAWTRAHRAGSSFRNYINQRL